MAFRQREFPKCFQTENTRRTTLLMVYLGRRRNHI